MHKDKGIIDLHTTKNKIGQSILPNTARRHLSHGRQWEFSVPRQVAGQSLRGSRPPFCESGRQSRKIICPVNFTRVNEKRQALVRSYYSCLTDRTHTVGFWRIEGQIPHFGSSASDTRRPACRCSSISR